MDCKPGSVPARGCPCAGEDHSSRRRIAAALQRSHPDVGTPHTMRSHSGGQPDATSLFELAPGGACPAAGHPAVARGLLPHDFTLACASPGVPLRNTRGHWPSAVWFLLRFPSGQPGSPLTTSLPCGARTFLPRTVLARRRSSVHLRPRSKLPRGGKIRNSPSRKRKELSGSREQRQGSGPRPPVWSCAFASLST